MMIKTREFGYILMYRNTCSYKKQESIRGHE